MDFQQIIVLVATILGWAILAAALIFSGVIFVKLYGSRDKEAAKVKKEKEEQLKLSKKAEKEAQQAKKPQRMKDKTAGNADLKARLQSKGTAPKRENVVSRMGSLPVEENKPLIPTATPTAKPAMSMNDFLDDELDEFDFAKKKSSNTSTSNGRNNGGAFPPPPPRL